MPDNITLVELKDLGLDPQNPRLPTTVKRDEDSMLKYIARTSSITELMTAIGQHGYFPGEPLIVVPSGKKRPKYIVVEGNRRLSALKLLDNPDFMPKSGSIRSTADEAEHRPKQIPCLIFDDRAEVINYLGYRHITGIKQWEPLAKARYIAQYFNTETNKKSKPDERYRTVARSIGSQVSYIRRQLNGMAVFKLIEDEGFFDIEGLTEENIPFSLLTTALGYESIQRFISSTEHSYVYPSKIRKQETEELVSWLFERDKDGETRLGDSRNIKKLALIIDDEAALKELRGGGSLDSAYHKTRGMSDEFTQALIGIEQEFGKLMGMVALIEFEDSQRERVRNIRKQAVLLNKIASSEDE